MGVYLGGDWADNMCLLVEDSQSASFGLMALVFYFPAVITKLYMISRPPFNWTTLWIVVMLVLGLSSLSTVAIPGSRKECGTGMWNWNEDEEED